MSVDCFFFRRENQSTKIYFNQKKNSRAQERKKFTKILVVVDQTAHSLCCSVFIILLCGFVLLCFFFACFISASYCLPLSCTTYICSFIVFFFFFFPATYTASISQCCFSLLLFFCPYRFGCFDIQQERAGASAREICVNVVCNGSECIFKPFFFYFVATSVVHSLLSLSVVARFVFHLCVRSAHAHIVLLVAFETRGVTVCVCVCTCRLKSIQRVCTLNINSVNT